MSFTILFSLTVLIVVFGVMRNLRRSKVNSHITIEELVRRLRPVPDGLTTLALHHLHPAASTVALDNETVWTMIEGTEGLTSMKENTQVLLAMVSYAQHWDPLGSIEVAKQMRRDALALHRAIIGIGLGLPGVHCSSQVRICVHEAASAYYLMRQRLLVFYDAHSLPAPFPA